ncbi:MAG: hypothetical protein HKO92_09705 [Flavobacteriaceae bacterium]|nr:hypothetical protein [Flavobacteriaceae bacterium]
MKIINYFLLLSVFLGFSQNTIDTKLISSKVINVDKVVGVNSFDTTYYIKDNIFFQKKQSKILEYSNVQLGTISSVNTFNPLKINVFYKDFNTVILLDNRLAEINKIDFNLISPFREVSHVAAAFDNDLWIFNTNTLQLELFSYLNNKTKAETLPIEGDVLDISSNYNYCWLLTSEYIYTFNYLGSLISKEKNQNFETIHSSGENIYLLKDNKIYYKVNNQANITELNIPELLISQFFVTNETLYIYDGKNLNQYQLIND